MTKDFLLKNEEKVVMQMIKNIKLSLDDIKYINTIKYKLSYNEYDKMNREIKVIISYIHSCLNSIKNSYEYIDKYLYDKNIGEYKNIEHKESEDE